MPYKRTGRPAGRHHGSKNKATIKREEIARRELAAREMDLADAEHRIIEARRRGQKLAKDVLEDLMNLGVGIAAYYQPSAPGQPANTNTNEDKFWRAAEFARDCASNLAKYQSPTYKAVAVQMAPVMPQQESAGPKLTGGKVIGRIGDPQRVYQQLIAKVG